MAIPVNISTGDIRETVVSDATASRISQEELRNVAALEEAWATSRAVMRRKIKAGAICEPGEYSPDPRAFLDHMPRLVRKATSDSLPMAILSFSELRMLQNFYAEGQFYPRLIREILDRFETEGARVFRADRERMRVVGCWNVSQHLKRRALFTFHLQRARILVRLHEMGVANATGCIVSAIQQINRQYFRDQYCELSA